MMVRLNKFEYYIQTIHFVLHQCYHRFFGTLLVSKSIAIKLNLCNFTNNNLLFRCSDEQFFYFELFQPCISRQQSDGCNRDFD